MGNFLNVCNRFTERWCGAIVLTYLSGSNLVDFTVDVINGVSQVHIILEAIVSIFGFLLVQRMIQDNFHVRREASVFKKQLASNSTEMTALKTEADKWRLETSRLLTGLATAIEEKFSMWHLTPAEREIGFYLLKGLSLKEIAEVRQVSERTVRQQTLTIYEKSGVAGRAELSAFFLKDLLPKPAEKSSPILAT